MSLNKVMLIGYVGKDPEIRYLGDEGYYKGRENFALATTQRRRDAAGKIREYTDWHTITAWNASADYIENNVKKGMLLYVEGKIHYNSWSDRSGNTKTVCEIFADNIMLLRKNSEETDIRQNNGQGFGIKEEIVLPDIDEGAGDDGMMF